MHTRALNVQLLATLHVQSHYTELQRALEARGFRVVRMDTYDSVIVQWSGDQHALAAAADVVALASPSAIRVSQGRARERAHTQERAHTLAGNSRLSWMSLLLSRLLALSVCPPDVGRSSGHRNQGSVFWQEVRVHLPVAGIHETICIQWRDARMGRRGPVGVAFFLPVNSTASATSRLAFSLASLKDFLTRDV